jgi:hypothetical protein
MTVGEKRDLEVQIVRWVDDRQPGIVECVLDDAHDEGRQLASVTTEKPDGVEPTRGQSQFVVLASSLRKHATDSGI